jgi:glycerophosphoryl diester phosphodiesterase
MYLMASHTPFVQDRMIAHRGASAYAPENTLAAMRLAAKMGATWVEVDVKLTADERAVILHDDEVDRTTNGHGFLATLPFDVVRDLDAGRWFDAHYAGEKIPTLEELVQTVLELDLGLQLELKPTAGDDAETALIACSYLRDHWPLGNRNLFVSSFSTRSLDVARRILPDVPRAFAVVVPPRDPAALLRAVDCQILHSSTIVLSDAQLATLDASGIEFAIATVNDAVLGRRLLAAGVQTILSDRPDLLA